MKTLIAFLYIKRGNISIEDDWILVELKEEREVIPLNIHNLIIFFDRCRIITATIQIITDKGCAESIKSKSKNKLFSVSLTRKYKSCSKKYKQFRVHINKKERTRVVKKLLKARNDFF